MSDTPLPPLRAVLRDAATRAVAWTVAGGALVATLGLFDPDPRIESLPERVGHAVDGDVAPGAPAGCATLMHACAP